MADQMLDWVEATLNDIPDRRFFTMMHVYFGNHWHAQLEQLWNQTYTDRIVKILRHHQDRLIMSLGAHVHRAQMMAPKSAVVDDIQIV